MKKFFALVLALVMALSLTTVAWGAATTVTTAAELATALANNEDVTLANDIVLTGEWTPIGNEDTDDFYTGTLDGQGHTISGLLVTSGDYAALIRAAKGATIKNLTVSGSVTADNAAGVVARVEGDTVIDNVVSNVTVSGSIKAGGISANVCHTDSVATFINCVNNGSVSCSGTAPGGSGGLIGYVNNDGIAEIKNCVNNGTVTGANTATQYAGAVIGYAAGTSAGTIIDYTNTGAVTGHFTDVSDSYNRYLIQDGVYLAGYCGTRANWTIAVAKIGDNLYESMADALTAAGASDTIVLLDDVGEVTVGQEVTIDPNGYAVTVKAATGYQVVTNTAGDYVVTAAVTFGDKFDLYQADNGMKAALKAKTPDVADLSFNEVGAKVNQDGSGNVAYIVANNGEYYVKTTTPYTTSYAVTYAGKTDVLYYVNVGSAGAGYYTYEEEVTAFANFGAKCGQLNVLPVPTALEVYFQDSDGKVYKAAANVGNVAENNYLLNGKIVTASNPAGQDVIKHAFVFNDFDYNAALKQNVPVKAICTTCLEQTSSIYLRTKIPATYVEQKTTGEGSTYYTVALAPNTVPGAVVPSVPSAPSTDKVQSAETFDVGIAMYVGMSVLAATGSAVVLKKRER